MGQNKINFKNGIIFYTKDIFTDDIVDKIEVHPVKDLDQLSDDGRIICEVCNKEDADYYSVYFHIKNNGVRCIADCDTLQTATDLQILLNRILIILK